VRECVLGAVSSLRSVVPQLIGEKIVSVRALLKRYTLNRVMLPFKIAPSSNCLAVMDLSISVPQSGWSTSQVIYYESFRSYWARCFLAERGGVRFKFDIVPWGTGGPYTQGSWTAVRMWLHFPEFESCTAEDITTDNQWLLYYNDSSVAGPSKNAGNGLVVGRDSMGLFEVTVPDFCPQLWRNAAPSDSASLGFSSPCGMEVTLPVGVNGGGASAFPGVLVYSAAAEDLSMSCFLGCPIVTHP